MDGGPNQQRQRATGPAVRKVNQVRALGGAGGARVCGTWLHPDQTALGTCATPPGPKGQGEAAPGVCPPARSQGLAASATVGTPAALACGQRGTIHGSSPRPACLGPPGPEVTVGQSPPGVPSEGAGWVPGLPLLTMPRRHLCPAPGGSAARPRRPCRGTGRSQWRGEPTGSWPAARLPLPGPPPRELASGPSGREGRAAGS